MSDRILYAWYVIGSIILSGLILLFAVCAHAEEGIPIPVLTIAYESSDQPFEGQMAVAATIKSRMAQRHQTAEQVCLAPYQFSCWKNGKPTQKRKLNQKEIDTAYVAWQSAIPWEYNHYCRWDSNPSWAKAAKKQLRLGQHIFYQL